MNLRRALGGMGAAALAGLLLGAAGARATDPGQAVPNRAAIEGLIHDYILAHPEIIPEAMEKLQANRDAKLIHDNRTAIEMPFAGAWAGNPHGDVTLVMFTDYACGYCRASAPDIDKLLAADPNLKVVWREIPVLGPQSEVAAHVALAAAKQGHYPAFHKALFADGHPDDAHLASAMKAAGVDPHRAATDRASADVQQEIDANLALAAKIGVSGTPAFVIGDRMVSGAVGYDALAKAIATARHGS